VAGKTASGVDSRRRIYLAPQKPGRLCHFGCIDVERGLESALLVAWLKSHKTEADCH
jgi:hypothetical protein